MSDELILIVEDNLKSRKLVRDLLQVNGYRTVESETAEEGLRLARESQPDLILMDIQLPGMDGIEALRHLKSYPETGSIPVIAVTASVMTHGRNELLDAGFDDYQRKPLEMKSFMEAVKNLVGKETGAEPTT